MRLTLIICIIITGIAIFWIETTAQLWQDLEKTRIEQSRNPDGSYRQEPFNGTYRVDVYQTPNRQYGYQITETLEDGTILISAEGPESLDRTGVYTKESQTTTR